MHLAIIAASLLNLTGVTATPQMATIVQADSTETYGGDEIGNVKIKFTDGHTEMWTRKGHCRLPKISDSGLVGWLYFTDRNDRGWPVFSTLRVVWPDEHHRDFDSLDYPFIEDWVFTEKDTCVVIRSRRAHGPADYLHFRLADGKLLDKVHGPEGATLPDWTNPVRQ